MRFERKFEFTFLMGHQIRHGLAVAADHDAFIFVLDFADQGRKTGFRLVNVDCYHSFLQVSLVELSPIYLFFVFFQAGTNANGFPILAATSFKVVNIREFEFFA